MRLNLNECPISHSVDVVYVVMSGCEVKSSNGLLSFSMQHLRATKANTAALVVKRGLVGIQCRLYRADDSSLVVGSVNLEALHNKTNLCSVAPVAPFKGQ